MSALPWIAAALGGGALYLWYRSKQQQTGGGLCATACAQMPAGAQSACIATCNALGGALSGFDGGASSRAERDRRQALNDKLNGPADVMNPFPISLGGAESQYPSVIQSKVLRYQNGCVPLYDAPGFDKCAAGTLDMYLTAITSAAGDLNYSEAQLVEPGVYPLLVDVPQEPAWRHINKTHAMAGQSGDPTTQGPWTGTDGKPFWFVRGKRVSCDSGNAPRAVVLQTYADTAADSDESATTCVNIYQNPDVVSQGGGCANGMPTIPGTTWDPTLGGGSGAWRRARAGEAINPGPCAQVQPLSTSDVTSHAIDTRSAA